MMEHWSNQSVLIGAWRGIFIVSTVHYPSHKRHITIPDEDQKSMTMYCHWLIGNDPPHTLYLNCTDYDDMQNGLMFPITAQVCQEAHSLHFNLIDEYINDNRLLLVFPQYNFSAHTVHLSIKIRYHLYLKTTISIILVNLSSLTRFLVNYHFIYKNQMWLRKHISPVTKASKYGGKYDWNRLFWNR